MYDTLGGGYILMMPEIGRLTEISKLCHKNDIDMALIFLSDDFAMKIKLMWVHSFIRMQNANN